MLEKFSTTISVGLPSLGFDMPARFKITAKGIDSLRDIHKQGSEHLADETMTTMGHPAKIFIVHGKDEENKKILKDMLVQWGLDPIILEEKPSKGKTLIEKLIEHASQVSFAFIIMTPDDIGMEKSSISRFNDSVADFLQGSTLTTIVSGTSSRTYPSDLPQAIDKAIRQCFEPRVRQNIIFEYGLCMGLLGREKVRLLLKGNVSVPTDILGIAYARFHERLSEDDCKGKIKQELEEIGYKLKP